MGLLDILQQYAGSEAKPTGDVFGHFDAVAQQATPSALGNGIAAALRSDATPALGQTLGGLFGQSNPEQKAGLLNEIIQTLGPVAAASAGGGVLSRLLGTSGAAPTAAVEPVTPAQAAQISPSEAGALATAAQQHDGSVVDRFGTFYAQHPTLVKTLGVAALGAVMSHMSQRA